jgi:protein TonB
MNIVRLGVGSVFAFGVTFGLFVLMYTLIATNQVNLDSSKPTKLADIHMPEKEITAKVAERKPDKPDEPDEPPPEMEQPDMQDLEVNTEAVNMSVQVKADINISSGPGLGASDGEYLPIVKVAPIYPRRAQSRGIEGYCTIEYTVTKAGTVKDPVAIDCKPEGVFERASLKAAEKFKYKPRVVDGEPIDVVGVQNRFTYQLEK